MTTVVIALALIASGTATWYATGPGAGDAAAGTELRRALGPGWRGTTVQVCDKRCVTVRLTDTCECAGARIIDLSDEDFEALAHYTKKGRYYTGLDKGVIHVSVRTIDVSLPPTDVEPSSTTRPSRLAL